MASDDKNEKKPALKERLGEWRGHLGYLRELVKEDPGKAWDHWKSTYKEQDALKAAITELSTRCQSDDFSWEQVTATLTRFHLRTDDLGQAEWYQNAHRQYEQALARLDKEQRFRPAFVEGLIKELRFLAEANDFHQKFGLSALQARIKTMYHALVQRIDEFNAIAKEELAVKKQQAELEKIKAQEAVVAAENEKVAQQNRLVQEQRMKVMEERKRLEAKRAADEAEQLRLEKQREYDAEESHRKRQQELQDSFKNLQWGSNPAPAAAPAPAEPAKPLTIDAQIDSLMKQLQTQEKLSGTELAATARLYDMLRKKFSP
ncbi:hypothetical protein HPT27_00680 [Permianibacter sp. IMCC34836]|uniref:hypothetical protein n=1 Tax=Permianibacter fluminis TaxID=2738515 RepID=UPI001553B04E|nr:hypothetical protein [Permianibacter fluminis]NQD35516.1 hypothetical protein [Permianibacter fluminis]